MTTRTQTILVLITAAVLGVTVAAVHNHFHPAMPWDAFNKQADAIGLQNALTGCERKGDGWVCLTYEADFKTECTQDACAPLTEIE